jgi:hypothetical protein
MKIEMMPVVVRPAMGIGWRRALLVFGAAVALIGGVTPAAAQTRADTAEVVLEVARRLELEGQREAARQVYRLLLRDFAGTPAAMRGQTSLALGARQETAGDGRTELLVGGVAYGLWLGVAVPLALGADSPEPYGLGLLLGGPAGFLAAREYTRNRTVSDGQASAITFGGLWGTWQGFGWADVARLGQRAYPCDSDRRETCYYEDGTEERVLASIVGGLAGIGTGVYLARNPIRAGTATAASLGGMWGAYYGFATALLIDIDADRATQTMALIGGNIGLVGTALVAERMQISRERARLISIAGVAGLLGGLGVNLLVQPESDRVLVLIPTIGSVAGLAAGAAWTRDHAVAAPGGGGNDGLGGALLHFERGRLGMSAPMPYLTSIEADAAGGRRAAAGVPLLRVRW